ncbi:WAT1-related protein [Citrus sinensis]|uniref:WAT1-related protein At3g28050-like isoform X2 n=1 Tax=Citrus sinensis TaxID=2711 RepID=UPI0003D70FC3|nr:WAT1-related protein At3g28050-like isoform X2 [Citrus sinensis]KAH9709085.1 WAT1-related protein [Citrus sinensis]
MWSVGVTAVMVAVECLEVGSSTLNKAAMNKGTSDFVLIVYSNAFAAIFILLPSTFIYYRNRTRPPLTVSIICKIFGLGLISCCVQTCLYVGIGYSSPTLSSAIVDLTPAFTFILALISRMEKLDLRVQSSLAKSIGTMVSIAGALTVTLYKGPALVTSSFFLSLLYIVQTSIIREYPEELMATFICCVFVTIQSTVVALIAERNPNSWRLKPDMELIAIGCSAFFAVALRSLAHTWACHKKGPVYVSMYKPLGIVFAIIMGVTLLGDTLYLGSVVGATIVAFGFYSVIWGQSEEEKMIDDKDIDSLKSSSPKAPLLQTKSIFCRN